MSFVSCIKVKGIYLLPPLISEKRRSDLQRYKQEAMRVEKRLKQSIKSKRGLELSNYQPLSEHRETFRDVSQMGTPSERYDNNDIIRHINDKPSRKVTLSKDIIDVTQYNDDGIKIIDNESEAYYPELYQGHQLNHYSRSGPVKTDMFHHKSNEIVSPNHLRNNDTLKFSTEIKDCQLLDLTNQKENTELDTKSVVFDYLSPKNSNDTIEHISPQRSPRPRLIRSNSYTLETPSPILLAHIEKNKNCEVHNTEQFNKHVLSSRNWSSMENNYIPFEDSEFSSINTVFNNSVNIAVNNSDETFSNIPINTTDENILENCTSPVVEIIQTDITLQQITVNANSQFSNNSGSDNAVNADKTCMSNINLNSDWLDSDSQLMCILKNIPEDSLRKIIALIQKQNHEQQREADNLEKVKNHLLDDSAKNILLNTLEINENDNSRKKSKNSETRIKDNIVVDCNELINKEEDGESISSVRKPNLNHNNTNANTQHVRQNTHQTTLLSESDKFDSAVSASPTQSLYYSITSSETVQTSRSPSLRVTDLEYGDFMSTTEKHNFLEKSSKDVMELYRQENNKISSSSRELFPEINAVIRQDSKREWAAAVIGANVKGYLTRRLLKTERVQALIDTIKDALMCALQLHNAENIEESDIELHRRLINQVSAACYAFHDIFFSLSVQEQMMVISSDRQRKIEKARRPTSAPASHRSRSSSSRSSSKQKFQHSQSLTKV